MCDQQFERAFAYQNGLTGTAVEADQYNPFNGCGGLRALAARLDLNPVLPPLTGLVRLVWLHYAGVAFTLEYPGTSMTVELLDMAGAAAESSGLTLNTTVGGTEHHMS
eukprot:gene3286-627_t